MSLLSYSLAGAVVLRWRQDDQHHHDTGALSPRCVSGARCPLARGSAMSTPPARPADHLPDQPCTYYVTWATIDDVPWLTPEVEPPLLTCLHATAAEHGASLVEAMVHPASIHLIVTAPTTLAIADLVTALRTATAQCLRMLPGPTGWPESPWADDPYIATVGWPDTPALAAYFARHRPKPLQ